MMNHTSPSGVQCWGAKGGLRARCLALCGLATLLMAGCATSPPSRFYTLTSTPASAAAPSAATAAPPIRVASVHIPPMLDRQEIARPSAGNQLEINGQERWDAPLDEMIQQVLTRDLLTRLPAGKVILPSAPAPANLQSIALNVLQFQSDVSGSVVLEGSWSLVPSHATSPILIRDFRYTAAASSHSTADEVSTMSALLGQLADEIASSLPAH